MATARPTSRPRVAWPPRPLTVEALQALVADNPTFAGFDHAGFETLLGLVAEIRTIPAGAWLVREGERAETIFIVESGRFEVLKQEPDGERAHRIALLAPGMTVGEIALLDAGPRSASVRALDEARVLVIPVRDLDRLSPSALPVDVEMKLAFGHELARRLRSTNDATVRSLREMLHEAEIRAEMGRFMCRLLIGAALYMYAFSVVTELKPYMASTRLASILILLGFAASVVVNIRTSSFPAAAYGFTSRNWRAAVREALLFSLPVAGLIVLAKAVALHSVPQLAGEPLFDLSRSRPHAVPTVALLVLLYVTFVPVQEMAARSVQSALMLYLRGRFRIPLSILVAALLFSGTHLHVSSIMAIGALPLGIFWGWLYLRNPTLIGVSLSHLMLGLFVFFVVGLPEL